MKNVPQLRVVLNTMCGKKCVYCRPSGEASSPVKTGKALSAEDLCICIRELVAAGIGEVRFTGGDPAFYPHQELVWIIGELAKMRLCRLSLVTRSHVIRHALPSLLLAGLSNITFSLDSMDAGRWVESCGIAPSRSWEHGALLETIIYAKRLGFNVRVNSVLVNDTCNIELPQLVEFVSCWNLTLKIEEVIRDIGTNGRDGFLLHADLLSLKEAMRKSAVSSKIEIGYGGLGHPMETFNLENGVSVIWKMFDGGACYGSKCRLCKFFPCDDALMALRLLPDGRLQACLKRNDNLSDLMEAIKNGQGRELIEEVLVEYAEACRLDSKEIAALRMAHRQEKEES